jgi:hypothetical protein
VRPASSGQRLLSRWQAERNRTKHPGSGRKGTTRIGSKIHPRLGRGCKVRGWRGKSVASEVWARQKARLDLPHGRTGLQALLAGTAGTTEAIVEERRWRAARGATLMSASRARPKSNRAGQPAREREGQPREAAVPGDRDEGLRQTGRFQPRKATCQAGPERCRGAETGGWLLPQRDSQESAAKWPHEETEPLFHRAKGSARLGAKEAIPGARAARLNGRQAGASPQAWPPVEWQVFSRGATQGRRSCRQG